MGRSNARKTPYRGVTYDSQMEADYARELDRRMEAGEVERWERQVAFILQPAYSLEGKAVQAIRYTADFLVWLPDGSVEVVEVKGRWGRDDLLRWKMLGWLVSTRGAGVLDLAGLGTVPRRVRLRVIEPERKPRKKKAAPRKEPPPKPRAWKQTRMTSAEYRDFIEGGPGV